MWNITLKEFKDLFYNPKFILTFFISTVLIVISIVNGYTAYSSAMESARMGEEVAISDAKGMDSYDTISRQGLRVSRFPGKLSIFDIGISGVVGSKSDVRAGQRPRARDSRYSLDPILAVFGELDLTYTVAIILSLFAILFSYNAVSGEREDGTLKLMASNPVKRSSIILGKLIGGFMPLALLFIFPFLIGLTGLLLLTDIQFSGDEWILIALMAGTALLYLLVFFSIGLAMSTLTRNSFVSFLLCLFVWVLSVAIFPKVAVQVAAQTTNTMSLDDVESRFLAYKQDRSMEWMKRMEKYFDENPVNDMTGINEMFRDTGSRIRQEIEAEDEKFADRLFDEYQRKKDKLLSNAINMSRLSPTSSFVFASHVLSDTGPSMLADFESELTKYRRALVDYLKVKQADAPEQFGMHGISITKKDGKMKFSFGSREAAGELDISDMPRFSRSGSSLVFATTDALTDFGLLSLYSIIFFAIAYVAFIRYDVR